MIPATPTFSTRRMVSILHALLPLLAILLCRGVLPAALSNDLVFNALGDELHRTMNRLHIGEMARPYFLEYSLREQQVLELDASFGGIVDRRHERLRFLSIGMRVGDYRLDNSNFIASTPSGVSKLMHSSVPTVVDDDYDALRNQLWLLTDEAYKNALDALSRKKIFLRNSVGEEIVPGFSKAPPYTYILNMPPLPPLTDGEWPALVREVSAVFKKYPAILQSNVHFLQTHARVYYINSDGSRRREPKYRASLMIRAETLAADGQTLTDFVVWHAVGENELPDKAGIMAAARELAEELTRRRTAMVLTMYDGPVLFTDQAAGELLRRLLARNLLGMPPLLVENKSFDILSAQRESAFSGKVGMVVMPEFFDIWDDPTAVSETGRPLIGRYAVDDECVVAQRVPLVEEGVLQGFLLSRTPISAEGRSNGHGRLSASGAVMPKTSNLFLHSRHGRTLEELKSDMLEVCRRRRLPYGLLIRTLEIPGLLRGDDEFDAIAAGREWTFAKPLAVYRVYPDGTMQAVRGLEFAGVTVRTLLDIIAAGNTPYVYNYLDGDSPNLRIGGNPLSGTPCSIVTPALLIDNVELKKSAGRAVKPPMVPRPPLSEPIR